VKFEEIIVKIKVKPKSKKEYIKKISDNEFEVAMKEVPEKGRANKRLIELISKYFGVSKRNVKIIKGEKSRKKILKIEI